MEPINFLHKEEDILFTSLLIAIEKQDSKAVYSLLNQVESKNYIGMSGYTLLHYAVKTGNISIAEMLVNAGSHIEAKNDEGETCLHLACYNNNHGMASFLLNNGANVNEKNNNMETPIFYAVRRGNMRLIRLLHDHGAEMNISNRYHVTLEEEANENTTLREEFNVFFENRNKNLHKDYLHNEAEIKPMNRQDEFKVIKRPASTGSIVIKNSSTRR